MRPNLVALGSRDLRLFFAGQLVSVIGTWMQSVALGWLVLTLTGSALWLGIATAVRFLPALVVTLPAGLVADRHDRRIVLLWTSIVSGVAAAILAILTLGGWVTIGWVIAITAIAGAANAFEAPARQALVAELAGAERRAAAIALNSVIWNGARVVGPAIAGVGVATIGPGWIFAVNAVSYLAVILAVLLVAHRPAPRLVAATGAYRELGRYLRSNPAVTWLLALIGLNTMLASGYLYLGPAVARDLGVGPDALGLLLSAAGIGAVVAGLRLSVRPSGPAGGPGLVGPAVVTGVVGLAMPLAASLPVAALLFGLVAVGGVSYNVTTNTRIQAIVPDRLRGRVMSLYALMLFGCIPPGSVVLGAIADRIGALGALAIGAGAWLAIAMPIVIVVGRSRATGDAPAPASVDSAR